MQNSFGEQDLLNKSYRWRNTWANITLEPDLFLLTILENVLFPSHSWANNLLQIYDFSTI